MRMEGIQHRLKCLGWLCRARQIDGRWVACAKGCGHTLIAVADNRQAVWSAIHGLATKVTRPVAT